MLWRHTNSPTRVGSAGKNRGILHRLFRNSCTIVVVSDTSSGLYKLPVPRWALGASAALGFAAFLAACGFGFNYARMALLTGDHEQLLAENTALKVENRNYQVTTRQLDARLGALEAISGEIQEMFQDDVWIQRFELDDALGVGGSVGNVGTDSMIASLNTRDNLDLTRIRALEIETQLQFAEDLALRRNGMLRVTPSVWPVSGPIRSGYGRRRDPFTGEPEFHQGIDIAALYGSAIRAPASGRVVFAGRQSAYGNLIVLDHGDGVTTRYGHLSRMEVRVGDPVSQDALIGYVGNTGRSTGPHLHYEVRVDDRSVNPGRYLPANSRRP